MDVDSRWYIANDSIVFFWTFVETHTCSFPCWFTIQPTKEYKRSFSMIFWLLKFSVWKVIVLPVDISDLRYTTFYSERSWRMRRFKCQSIQLSQLSILLVIFQPHQILPTFFTNNFWLHPHHQSFFSQVSSFPHLHSYSLRQSCVKFPPRWNPSKLLHQNAIPLPLDLLKDPITSPKRLAEVKNSGPSTWESPNKSWLSFKVGWCWFMV